MDNLVNIFHNSIYPFRVITALFQLFLSVELAANQENDRISIPDFRFLRGEPGPFDVDD